MTKEQFSKLPEDTQATIFAAFMEQLGGGDMHTSMKMMFHASNCANCGTHIHAAFDAFINEACEIVENKTETLAETVMNLVNSALDRTVPKNMN